MIDPEFGASLWDVIRIGDMRSPGVATVTGPGLVIGWDIQNATAQSGAVTKRINEPLQKFEVEIDLSNEPDEYGFSDFDKLDDWDAYLKPMAAKAKPFARPVYYPSLAQVGVTAATLESIGLVAPDGKGGGKVKYSFIEFRPPKPNKPIASTKTEGDKKIDQATKDIDALQNEWKELGANPTPASIGESL